MAKLSIVLALVTAAVFPWTAAAQSGDPASWTGAPDEVLRFQIAQTLAEAKPGRRAEAVASLQEFAAQAAGMEDREAWAESQLGLARLALAAAGDELIEAEPLAILEDLLKQARLGKWSRIRVESLRLHAECLGEADRPLNAAHDLELAAGLAFEAGLVTEGIESLVDAARVYRNLGHAARVRQLWSLIDLTLAQRSAQVKDTTRAAVAKARSAAAESLALTPEPDEPLGAGVDFQPLDAGVVVSTAATEDGRARFLLTNHSSFPAEGTLTVAAGQAVISSWRAGTDGQMVFLKPAIVPKLERRTIHLLPGERLRLFLEYLPRHDNAAFSDTVSLVWTDVGGEQPTRCTFQFRDDVLRSSSIVNSNRLKSRPAWPVPVYHELYFRGGSVQTENILTTSSTPCRLEIYDEDTGELVAVDAEGDGIFSGSADILPASHDRDEDGRPDLIVSAEANVRSLEIYVFPLLRSEHSATVSVHLADYSIRPARWRRDAVDHVEK